MGTAGFFHKVIGLGHIISYAVGLQTETGTLAKPAKGLLTGEYAGRLPYSEGLLGEFVKDPGIVRLPPRLFKGQ